MDQILFNDSYDIKQEEDEGEDSSLQQNKTLVKPSSANNNNLFVETIPLELKLIGLPNRPPGTSLKVALRLPLEQSGGVPSFREDLEQVIRQKLMELHCPPSVTFDISQTDEWYVDEKLFDRVRDEYSSGKRRGSWSLVITIVSLNSNNSSSAGSLSQQNHGSNNHHNNNSSSSTAAETTATLTANALRQLQQNNSNNNKSSPAGGNVLGLPTRINNNNQQPSPQQQQQQHQTTRVVSINMLRQGPLSTYPRGTWSLTATVADIRNKTENITELQLCQPQIDPRARISAICFNYDISKRLRENVFRNCEIQLERGNLNAKSDTDKRYERDDHPYKIIVDLSTNITVVQTAQDNIANSALLLATSVVVQNNNNNNSGHNNNNSGMIGFVQHQQHQQQQNQRGTMSNNNNNNNNNNNSTTTASTSSTTGGIVNGFAVNNNNNNTINSNRSTTTGVMSTSSAAPSTSGFVLPTQRGQHQMMNMNLMARGSGASNSSTVGIISNKLFHQQQQQQQMMMMMHNNTSAARGSNASTMNTYISSSSGQSTASSNNSSGGGPKKTLFMDLLRQKNGNNNNTSNNSTLSDLQQQQKRTLSGAPNPTRQDIEGRDGAVAIESANQVLDELRNTNDTTTNNNKTTKTNNVVQTCFFCGVDSDNEESLEKLKRRLEKVFNKIPNRAKLSKEDFIPKTKEEFQTMFSDQRIIAKRKRKQQQNQQQNTNKEKEKEEEEDKTSTKYLRLWCKQRVIDPMTKKNHRIHPRCAHICWDYQLQDTTHRLKLQECSPNASEEARICELCGEEGAVTRCYDPTCDKWYHSSCAIFSRGFIDFGQYDPFRPCASCPQHAYLSFKKKQDNNNTINNKNQKAAVVAAAGKRRGRNEDNNNDDGDFLDPTVFDATVVEDGELRDPDDE